MKQSGFKVLTSKPRVDVVAYVTRLGLLIKLVKPVQLRIRLKSTAVRLFSKMFILKSPPHTTLKLFNEGQCRKLSRKPKN